MTVAFPAVAALRPPPALVAFGDLRATLFLSDATAAKRFE
jgi:hypothetical protein